MEYDLDWNEEQVLQGMYGRLLVCLVWFVVRGYWCVILLCDIRVCFEQVLKVLYLLFVIGKIYKFGLLMINVSRKWFFVCD